MLIGFALFAVALVVATRTDVVNPAFVALGLLAAGPIMSLPTRVLTPPVRAIAMGIHFTIFLRTCRGSADRRRCPVHSDWNGSRRLDLGALLLVLCFPAY